MGAPGGWILWLHEARFDGEDGGTGSIGHLELSEDRRDVGLDRLFGDEETLGDLAVRLAGREEAEHLLFPRRELRQLRARRDGLPGLELAKEARRQVRREHVLALDDPAKRRDQLERRRVL